MEEEDVMARLTVALERVAEQDLHLLGVDVSERCIASRLAMYLQEQFPEHHVDVEYNRDAETPKRLGLPEECANIGDHNGRAFVVPDVIVHRRGAAGPNILILELKKTTNQTPRARRSKKSPSRRECRWLGLCVTRPRSMLPMQGPARVALMRIKHSPS
jgi:hypothetical protein